jgi:formamidopyrimidine-DNA glycosylase
MRLKANIAVSFADGPNSHHTRVVPEIIEIELYRRLLLPIVGLRVAAIHTPDAWYLKHGLVGDALRDAALGKSVVALRRRGKLLLVDLGEDLRRPQGDVRGEGDVDIGAEVDADVDVDVVLGLRFGMTGRPLLDGAGPPMTLEYSSNRDETAWDRFTIEFDGGGRLRINDPRRLGGVELDPVESRLGPDAFTLRRADLRRALQSRAPVKAVLLDQRRIAGLGNLLADECCWRAGIDPARIASELTEAEIGRLHRAIRSALPAMLETGGSHSGRLDVALRVRGTVCPRDGTPLLRRTIGGRTTYSCPVHQR